MNKKSTLENEFNTIFIIYHKEPKPCAKPLMNENKANDILFCPTCMRCHQTDYESRCLFSAKHVKKHCIDAFARLCEKYAFGCRTKNVHV